ncbi:MAG: L-carnitine dehydratase/bile acid-inducible protein [Actinomycetia bacterium]|nr:L-carnitine dehydratase/bile acid-inducible protein [Actinomycetes bacterium]
MLDRTSGIAGPYCTKLLVDAGADVVKVEPADDPMRSWRDGLLFEYLHAGKRSVADDADLLGAADVLVTDDPADVGAARVVVTITPFGVDGPWVDRPATEFTLQAACGSMGHRGLPEDPPLAAGGRLGEWMTGTFAALAATAALRTGRPEHVDVAMLDCMAITMSTYPSVYADMAGRPPIAGTGRVIEVPSILPTADGWVVVTTNSATQFHDFLVQIGRPDLLEDLDLAKAPLRFARRDEFLDAVRTYTTARTSDEVLADASDFRIPAAPVLDGATAPDFEQFVARGVLRPSASGRLRQPRPPYRLGDVEAPMPGPVPAPRANAVEWDARPAPGAHDGLPLAGIRVLDLTAWWAGPAGAHVLGCLGADVVKVESVGRPDPMRFAAVRPPTEDRWWEWGPIFHAANANKRGTTLDLATPEGVDLFERLVATADVVVENFTPRVLDQFGLGWDRIHELNPRALLVRMPAFGLDGPWRDRTGFAQTMESVTGMAWVTGLADGPPVLVRGACDPLAGMHAVFATLLALRQRERTGVGVLVEATMVEAALNAAAEAVFEHDVHGVVLGREGNRGPLAAPQGAYRCAGDDAWVALAVADDVQWEALRGHLGWEPDAGLATADGRRAAHDALDERLGAWFASQDAVAAAEALAAAGVPAEVVIAARDIDANPQLRHRRLFEVEDHPVTGRTDVPTMPFRFASVERWMRLPSPTLGQHNDEVLGEVADADELAALRRAGAIGERMGRG